MIKGALGVKTITHINPTKVVPLYYLSREIVDYGSSCHGVNVFLLLLFFDLYDVVFLWHLIDFQVVEVK